MSENENELAAELAEMEREERESAFLSLLAGIMDADAETVAALVLSAAESAQSAADRAAEILATAAGERAVIRLAAARLEEWQTAATLPGVAAAFDQDAVTAALETAEPFRKETLASAGKTAKEERKRDAVTVADDALGGLIVATGKNGRRLKESGGWNSIRWAILADVAPGRDHPDRARMTAALDAWIADPAAPIKLTDEVSVQLVK